MGRNKLGQQVRAVIKAFVGAFSRRGGPRFSPRPPAPYCRLQVEALEDRTVPSIDRPLLFVPGQPASVPTTFVQYQKDPVKLASALDDFLGQLGLKPWQLTSLFTVQLPIPGLKPIVSPTNALVQTLTSPLGGYTLGKDLFVATQDWRMQVAPLDPDGSTPGILDYTAQSVADRIFAPLTAKNPQGGIFQYGVDYLAWWLEFAAQTWANNHGGVRPDTVDLIAHSEGYVISRAYIDSQAYGGFYDDPRTVGGSPDLKQLPKIAHYIDLAGPNEGASGIYNLLQNNWINPLGMDLEGGLYMFIEPAYLHVKLLGEKILGPDGEDYITPDNLPDPATFIQMYVPSLRAEMPTYPFLYNSRGQLIDFNHDPAYSNFRNDLLLDINGGPDPNAFAKRVTMGVTAIFALGQKTMTYAVEHTGPGGTVLPVDSLDNVFWDALRLFRTLPGQPWVQDISIASFGDRYLAPQSSVSTFLNDPQHILLIPRFDTKLDHGGIVTDFTDQRIILAVLRTNGLPPAAQVVPAPEAAQRLRFLAQYAHDPNPVPVFLQPIPMGPFFLGRFANDSKQVVRLMSTPPVIQTSWFSFLRVQQSLETFFRVRPFPRFGRLISYLPWD